MASIKENAEFARKLSLPVSQRTFDRHIPGIDTRRVELYSSSENEEDSSDSGKENENKDKRKLIKREEVYLVKNNQEIFNSKYEETEFLKSFVHGKILFAENVIFDSKD